MPKNKLKHIISRIVPGDILTIFNEYDNCTHHLIVLAMGLMYCDYMMSDFDCLLKNKRVGMRIMQSHDNVGCLIADRNGRISNAGLSRIKVNGILHEI